MKTKKGEVVNAVYGFLLIFLKALKELNPDFVVATFDLKGPTFRHKEYKEYKIQRPKAPDELYQQIDKTREILGVFGIPVLEKKGFEADDVIGTISQLVKKKQIFPKIDIIILSGDLDILQLVDAQTKVWTMRKGVKDIVFYGEEEVEERYQGLKPSQLPDFKGLKGDASDNIPGVPGIGEKTAIQLIKEFGNLENLYEKIEKSEAKIKESLKEKLKQYKEQAFLSKKLAQIHRDVPIDFDLNSCSFKLSSKEKIIKVLKDFEFYTLIKRIEEVNSTKKSQGSLLNLSLTQKTREKKSSYEKRKQNAEEDVEQEIERFYKEGIFSEKIYQIEKKLLSIVREMEENGIKLDRPALSQLSKELEKKIEALENKIYELAGVRFNLNSPQQVSEILFKKLKISSQKIKKTPGGVLSTSSQELKKIRGGHPIVDLILDYREIFKLKSGFCDNIKNLINPQDGRVHPRFHQLGTATGRMSCSNPNLQNIPIRGEIGKEIRRCFIPEKGFSFISADYSQVELRIAASLSGDKKLIQLFNKGEDIHKITAGILFNVPKEKVSQKERDIAKSLNFALLYGMSPQGFSERTGIPLSSAKEFIEKYFQEFPTLASYRKFLIEEAKKKGFVETLFGRKRFLSEINSIDPRLRNQAERIAINTKIQGTSSDIIKMAMVRLKKEGIIDQNCRLILQIHDELLFEARKEVIEEKVPEIKKIMENIVRIEIPLEVDIKIGDNWGEMKVVVK